MNISKTLVATALVAVMIVSMVAVANESDAVDATDKLTFIVDGQGYDSLELAIGAIESEGTITVKVSEVGTGAPIASSITIPAGKDITLDLNGCTVQTTERIYVLGSLTIEDNSLLTGYEPQVSDDYKQVTYEAGELANVHSVRESQATTIVVKEGGMLTQNSGTISSLKNYTVSINGNTTPGNSSPIASSMVMNGGYQIGAEGGPGIFGNGAVLDVNGGVICGTENSPVAGNGTVNTDEDDGGTEININGGTLIGLMGDANRQSGYASNAIYHPQSGILNINGGTIVAERGPAVVMRAGQLNIAGGEIISTGAGTDADSGYGKVGDSSFIVKPSAIIYELKSNYPGLATDPKGIEITGGSFSSDIEDVVLLVEGDTSEVNIDISISGGTFSGDVSDYVASGFKQVGSIVGPVDQSVSVSGNNANVESSSETDTVVIPVDGEGAENATVSVSVNASGNIPEGEGADPKVSMVFQGDIGNEGLAVSAKQVASSALPDTVIRSNLLATFDLSVQGATADNFNLTVTVSIPTPVGMVLSNAWVIYYDDSGEEKERIDATVNGSEITFSTTHTSAYSVYGEYAEEGSGSGTGSWDDDEDLPPFIPTQPAEDDDTVTIVACAAAAAVAAILAVFLVIDRKG